MTFDISPERYDAPVVTRLVDAVQAEYVLRYGAPDEGPIEVNEFAAPHGCFLVGYLDGIPVATGGLRRVDADTVELKRMYVVPEARGRGLSRVMLARLEQLARDMGARRILLETGLRQFEAVSLYETSGYARITGFGHYAGHELSRSYAKDLADDPVSDGEA
jgi:GNAT superfamily N-acetyltransferase